MSCTKHPLYKASRKPVNNCDECLAFYEYQHGGKKPEEKIETPEEDEDKPTEYEKMPGCAPNSYWTILKKK